MKSPWCSTWSTTILAPREITSPISVLISLTFTRRPGDAPSISIRRRATKSARYFIENALQWIADFRIDALRLDASTRSSISPREHFLEELCARPFIRKRKNSAAKSHLILESNRNDPRGVETEKAGGWGFDAVWNDDFHHSLHVLLTGEQEGYYEDYSAISKIWRAVAEEGFLYAGRYSKFRQARYGNSSKEIPAKRFVVCAQNHDQIGNRRAGDRLSQSLSLDQLKLAAARYCFRHSSRCCLWAKSTAKKRRSSIS